VTAILAQSLTLEEFLKLPETKPASEWVDGYIYQKPMPQGKHARLQLKFCDTVNRVAEESRIALAFPELRCTFGERSIVPDATVFAWDRIPLEPDGEVANVFNIHPDWVVEILSPDQSTTKVIRNILHCLKHGTQLGWLLDPEEHLILGFMPGREPVEFTGGDSLPVPSFLSLELTVDRVFDWLKVGELR
jgi:Uma2 family endonuclease